MLRSHKIDREYVEKVKKKVIGLEADHVSSPCLICGVTFNKDVIAAFNSFESGYEGAPPS